MKMTKLIPKPLRRLGGAIGRLVSAASALSDLRNPRAWLIEAALGHKTSAGVHMSPDLAHNIGAYHRALSLVSADVAKLPLWLYARDSQGGRRRLDSHPVTRLIHTAPNPEMSAFAFRETLTHFAMAWHGGFARIEFEGTRASALWPLHPSTIRAERKKLGGDMAELVYAWTPDDENRNAIRYLFPFEVFHIHGLGGDGISGYSVAALARRALGISAATEEYTAAYYGNGVWGGGVLEHPGKMSPEAQKNLSTSFSEAYGGPNEAFRPIVLEEGVKFNRLALPAEDTQFLESRRFTVEEIARWFGIPPHKLGALERATFSNIEQQAIEYVQDALMPWLVRWEQEIQRKLLGPRMGNLYAEHNITALLRGDQAARSTFYREMLNIGVLSPNDIRRLENMDPITVKGGNEYYMQSAMATLEDIVEPPEPPAPPPPPEPRGGDEGDAPEDDGPQDDDGGAEASVTVTYGGVSEADPVKPDAEAMRGLLSHTVARVLRRELKAASTASKRYEGNWAGFTKWAGKFYGDQRDSLHSSLEVIWPLCPTADTEALDGWVCDWGEESRAAAERRQRAGTLVDDLPTNYETEVASVTDELMALMGLEAQDGPQDDE